MLQFPPWKVWLVLVVCALGVIFAVPNLLQMAVGQGDEVMLALSPAALDERRADAVSRSIEIIRRRIGEAGVEEPTIEREGNDRIVIELPGVADPQRLKQLIGKTARLTFQPVSDHRRVIGARRDPDFAGDRRHSIDPRHGGRRQCARL